MRFIARLFAVVLAIALAGAPWQPAVAGDKVIYAPNGIAIQGYDPVAYFTEGKAVHGSADYALRWRGATWYFVSEDAMETFEMNPKAYAPQYGGHCAYAMTRGELMAGSPEIFTVANGRLYFNFSDETRSLWRKDIKGNVAAADRAWPKFFGSN